MCVMFWGEFKGIAYVVQIKNCIVGAFLLFIDFSKGMEIWNPIDGSVQMIFKEIPPEYGQSHGQNLSKNVQLKLLKHLMISTEDFNSLRRLCQSGNHCNEIILDTYFGLIKTER